MNSDRVTTIVGAIGAAAIGAEPVAKAISGEFGTKELVMLIVGALFGVQGYFTNKQKVVK